MSSATTLNPGSEVINVCLQLQKRSTSKTLTNGPARKIKLLLHVSLLNKCVLHLKRLFH